MCDKGCSIGSDEHVVSLAMEVTKFSVIYTVSWTAEVFPTKDKNAEMLTGGFRDHFSGCCIDVA